MYMYSVCQHLSSWITPYRYMYIVHVHVCSPNCALYMHMYMYKCNYNFFLSPHVVPEDYDYNPHSGKRGDRSHHTELKHSSVEYIAPSEYMVSNSNISYLITCTFTCTFLHVHVSDYQSIRHVTRKYEVLVHPRSVDIIYILFFHTCAIVHVHLLTSKLSPFIILLSMYLSIFH